MNVIRNVEIILYFKRKCITWLSLNDGAFIRLVNTSFLKIPVNFTPAYHAATNGAIEKRHQTIKNSLKASLVDMGNVHGDKWISALPWVLLGKRIQVQPDLDVSAAQLVFGKSLSIPGQLLNHPGAPLSNVQTRHLLEQLYKEAARPAIPTSTVVDPIDLSHTENSFMSRLTSLQDCKQGLRVLIQSSLVPQGQP